MGVQLKAYQFYFLFMIFSLIALAGLVHIGLTYGLVPYLKLRNLDNYSELTEYHYKVKNLCQEEIEKEMEKTKRVIFSEDMDIVPFEMYSYLVYYKALRDMQKGTNLQLTSKQEIRDRDFQDGQVYFLTEFYKMDKNDCIGIRDRMRLLKMVARASRNKKSILNYLSHQREKLSEYCTNLFRE